MSLIGKQKRYLRSQAHHMQPIFQIGKQGVNPALVQQIDEALEKREMFKISLLQNTDEVAKEVAPEIAAATNSEVVQIIGRVIVLYRASRKEKNQHYSREVRALA